MCRWTNRCAYDNTVHIKQTGYARTSQFTILLHNEHIILNEVIELYLQTTVRLIHQFGHLGIVAQLVTEHHQQITHCEVCLKRQHHSILYCQSETCRVQHKYISFLNQQAQGHSNNNTMEANSKLETRQHSSTVGSPVCTH